MTRAVRLWIGAVVLNAVWMWLLHGRTARAVALLGIATALLLTIRAWRDPRVDDGLEPPAALLALFTLPILSFAFVPVLGFWRVDGRAWLVIAWLATAAILDARQTAGAAALRRSGGRARRPLLPMPIGLFIAWTAALWMTILFDLGVGWHIVHTDQVVRSFCRGDPLATMVSIWEHHPAREHWFLGWRSADAFAARTVYENHVHPYLLLMYAWIAAVRAVARLPLASASRTTPILYMAVWLGAVVALLARSGLARRCRGPRGWLVLFVTVGFVCTTWRFWGDLYQFNSDSAFPLQAAAFALVYAFLLPPARPALSAGAAALFAAIGPLNAPILVLAVACVFGRAARSVPEWMSKNRTVIRACSWCLATAIVVAAVPVVLALVNGYHMSGSSFIFRSGLDGDRTFFTNMIQAAWSACPLNCCGSPRPIVDLLFPAFIPLAVAAAMMWRGTHAPRIGGFARLLMFLSTLYIVSLVFFPQSVSIHPYLYDHYVLVPVVTVGVLAMTTSQVRERLQGAWLLAFLLASAAVIMGNLVALAQVLATLR